MRIEAAISSVDTMQQAEIQEDLPIQPSFVWNKVQATLSQEIPAQFFKAFISKLRVNPSLDNGDIQLVSEDKQLLEHVKKRYLNRIKSLTKELSDMNINLHFQSKKEPDQIAEPTAKPSNETAYPNYIALNPRYTFERFVKGPSNEHAFAAAMGAASAPSEFHNPLYIYGGVGLGKTHLMMAIGNFVKEKMPWFKVHYAPAETFQSDLVEAVQNKNLPHFKAKYRNIDLFLFDDIQFISARADYTQEEIFHTFNYLYQNGKQIVISGDRPPQQLSTLSDRLQSRFQSGLIVDIKAPNYETRLAILRNKANEMNLDVPFEVLQYMATRISSQIRALEAGLIKLKFTCDVEKSPIDMQMAKLSLKDLPIEDKQPLVTIDEILRVVSRTWHVDETEIKGNSRIEAVAMARHICMYLAKKMIPSMSLSSIAHAFGRSDHSTVIHAEKKIREMIDKSDTFQVQLQELIEELQF